MYHELMQATARIVEEVREAPEHCPQVVISRKRYLALLNRQAILYETVNRIRSCEAAFVRDPFVQATMDMSFSALLDDTILCDDTIAAQVAVETL